MRTQAGAPTTALSCLRSLRVCVCAHVSCPLCAGGCRGAGIAASLHKSDPQVPPGHCTHKGFGGWPAMKAWLAATYMLMTTCVPGLLESAGCPYSSSGALLPALPAQAPAQARQACSLCPMSCSTTTRCCSSTWPSMCWPPGSRRCSRCGKARQGKARQGKAKKTRGRTRCGQGPARGGAAGRACMHALLFKCSR